MQTPASKRKIDRRQFLGYSSAAGLAALAGTPLTPAGEAPAASASPEADAITKPTKVYTAPDGTTATGKRVQPGAMPCGLLGRLKLSRIISGGNIISGWCHARDLQFVRPLAEAYLTPQKQFDTLQLMEEQGVNAMVIDMIQMDIIRKYREQRGGQIQTVVGIRPDWGKWGKPQWDDFKQEIQKTIERGPGTMFVHGGFADSVVQSGKPERIELIGKAIQFIREQGFAAGLGSHALEVPMVCDQYKIEPDYYFKTFHHDQYWSATPKDRRKRFCVDGRKHLDHNEFHDNIFCIDPEETIAYMRHKPQPWIAFKVLAGGAIPPQSGFQYAFEHGADFLAVGMFDFEVVKDIQIAREVLAKVQRERPWRSLTVS